MTRPLNQSLWLALAIVATGLCDAAVRLLSRADLPQEMPALPPFDPGQADTIRIGRIDDPMVLARTTAQSARSPWSIAASGLPADPLEVEALLAELADGVRASVVVEVTPDELEAYGLSGGNELRVDVESATSALASLYIGADAGGGNTWLRRPDDPRVFQANIGGRARYDRKPSSLRDRRLVDLDPASVDAITLRGAEMTLRARREGPRWRGDPIAVDDAILHEIVRSLSALRAIDVTDRDEGIDWTLATVVLEGASGSVEMQFGRLETNRYARRAGQSDIGRIRLPWVDRLADPRNFGDRTLWTAERIDRFSLRAPGREGLLERDENSYVIRQPAHIDIDPNHLSAVLSFLARPRVLAWGNTPDEFDHRHTWILQTDQGELKLEFGATDGERIAVRAGDRTGWLDIRTMRTVENLFGG